MIDFLPISKNYSNISLPSCFFLHPIYPFSSIELYHPNFKLDEEKNNNILISGSSGNIFQYSQPFLSNYLKNINYFIRCNHAPTKSFENWIGNFTNIRWIAFNALDKVIQSVLQNKIDILNKETNEKEIWIIWGPTQKIKEYQITSKLNLFFQNEKNIPKQCFLLSDSFLQYVDQWFFQNFKIDRRKKGIWWSSGFLAHFYFIHLISFQNKNFKNNIKLFHHGFYNKLLDTNKKILYHYWENLEDEKHHIIKQNKSNQGHRFDFEKQIYEIWFKNNLLFSFL